MIYQTIILKPILEHLYLNDDWIIVSIEIYLDYLE